LIKIQNEIENEIRTELFLNGFVKEFMFCCIDTTSVVLIYAPGLRWRERDRLEMFCHASQGTCSVKRVPLGRTSCVSVVMRLRYCVPTGAVL